ncbi:unnamed protein product, partial [Linum tenue]
IRDEVEKVVSNLRLPPTIFTGNKIVAEDGSPLRIELLDVATNVIVTLAPFASLKIEVVVLDGDFVSEDWSDQDFENNVVRQRDERRPLVTGELTTVLRNGVGELSNVAFGDNSSWIRCRKFMLGARVMQKKSASGEVVRVREARSELFVVKDLRGELYKKHFPPRLEDEVWRLEKVAKDGAIHRRLSSYGINTVKQLLQANVIDQSALRDVSTISTKTWNKIIEHANACVLDKSEVYAYTEHGEGIRLLFNCVYKLESVSFDDGQTYPSLYDLTPYQKVLIEHSKRRALSNPKNLILVGSCFERFQTLNFLGKQDPKRFGIDDGKSEPDLDIRSILRQKDSSSVEKEHMFDKVLTPSDVGKLNRLVIPKQYANTYFPPVVHFSKKKGLILRFDDGEGKLWQFRYSYWNSNQCYVLTKGWSRFVKEKNLRARDTISFHRDVGNNVFYIGWKRWPNLEEDHSPYLPFDLHDQQQSSLTTELVAPLTLSSLFGLLLVSLKHLDANHCNILCIPNLSKAQKLEILNLEGCANLVGVSSIQYLKMLQLLNLKGCQSLKRLPSLIRLKLLKTLDLSHCSNLTRLPPSLGCLPTLCELSLKNCEKLENLPRSVMHLMKSLETLNISGCSTMLKSISRDDNAVPSLTQPPSALPFMPSSGVTQEDNLPCNCTDIPIRNFTKDTYLVPQPQPITTVQQDSDGDLALQDVSSYLLDIRGEKAVESKDDDSMMIPLIISLLTKLRTALTFPLDTDSSHACSSSSQDYNTLSINHTEDSSSGQEWKIVNLNLAAKIRITNNTRFVRNIAMLMKHWFHDLINFDEGERNCRTRLAGYHQKHRRQTSFTTGTEEELSPTRSDLDGESNTVISYENEKCLLNKRTRTSDFAIEQNQHVDALENQLRFSVQHWDETSAIRNIEEDVFALIDELSGWHDKGKEVPKSVLAWVAEMEQSIPETVRSMKNAKVEAVVIAGYKKKMDVMLVIGELELRLLDMELSRITEEEDEIEAELQRLMDKKREILQH